MSRTFRRAIAPALALALVAGACGGDDEGGTDGDGGGGSTADIDFAALGLWDDGACDPALDPLKLGLMTTFESPVVSLEDQALALDAAAEAFNARGGANGACIEVVTCDDGATIDGAIECARQFVEAGIHATVNDQITAGHAEVAEAMAEAGIPRVAVNVINTDWADPNAYPLDAAGTGTAFLSPQALIDAEATTERKIVVPERLTRPHPLVESLRRELLEQGTPHYGLPILTPGAASSACG